MSWRALGSSSSARIRTAV